MFDSVGVIEVCYDFEVKLKWCLKYLDDFKVLVEELDVVGLSSCVLCCLVDDLDISVGGEWLKVMFVYEG